MEENSLLKEIQDTLLLVRSAREDFVSTPCRLVQSAKDRLSASASV